jgi:RNA polymerase sigma factor (sigma-70 family)
MQHSQRNINQLYARTYLMVYRFMLKKVYYDVCLAQDLAQDTFLKLRDKLAFIEKPEHYAMRSAKRVFIDHIRAKSVKGKQDLTFLPIASEWEDGSVIIPDNHDANLLFEDADSKEHLLKLMSSHVSSVQIEIVDKYLKGYNYREIGELLGMREGTVKTAMKRVRDKWEELKKTA